MNRITYSEARAKLASLLEQAVSDREPIIIKRRGHEDVALIAADELRGLLETAHLLSSPANGARLLAAIGRASSGKGLVKASLDDLQTLVREPEAIYKFKRKAR